MLGTRISRRSFLGGAVAAGFGCGGSRGSDPSTGAALSTSPDWTVQYFGRTPTRTLVWRCPGSPSGQELKGLFPKVDEASTGAPQQALLACAGSEHFWCGPGSGAVSVIRGVRAGLEPLSIGRSNNGLSCVTGPACRAEWELVGRAPSGTMRYRKMNWSLFVLPGQTWISAPELSAQELRIAALLNQAAPPPISDLEPGALVVDRISKEDSAWSNVAASIPAVTGADLIFAVTTSAFPAAPGARAGAKVPSLVRWHFPDADHAATALLDYQRQLTELRARYPETPDDSPTVDGASLLLRSNVSYDALAAYVGRG